MHKSHIGKVLILMRMFTFVSFFFLNLANVRTYRKSIRVWCFLSSEAALRTTSGGMELIIAFLLRAFAYRVSHPFTDMTRIYVRDNLTLFLWLIFAKRAKNSRFVPNVIGKSAINLASKRRKVRSKKGRETSEGKLSNGPWVFGFWFVGPRSSRGCDPPNDHTRYSYCLWRDKHLTESIVIGQREAHA